MPEVHPQAGARLINYCRLLVAGVALRLVWNLKKQQAAESAIETVLRVSGFFSDYCGAIGHNTRVLALTVLSIFEAPP